MKQGVAVAKVVGIGRMMEFVPGGDLVPAMHDDLAGIELAPFDAGRARQGMYAQLDLTRLVREAQRWMGIERPAGPVIHG